MTEIQSTLQNILNIKPFSNYFIGILLCVFPFYGFINIKLLVLSSPLVILLLYNILKKKQSIVQISAIHFFYIAFTLLCFISISWSINKAEALHYSFNWLILILWSFCTIYAKIKDDHLVRYLVNVFSFLSVLLFLQQIYVALNIENFGTDWNRSLKYNHNYTTSLLVMVFPFFLCNTYLKPSLKLIGGSLLLVLLLMVGSRGSILMYSLLLVLFAFNRFKILYSIISFTFLISFFLMSNYFSFGGEGVRISLIKHSIELWKSAPFFGLGIGNWNIFIDQFTLDIDYSSLQYIKSTRKLLSHNLFFKLLAEVGLIGFTLFLVGISYLLYECKSRFEIPFFKASFYSVLSFCFFASIYTFGDFNKFDFSGHVLILFTILGCVSNAKKSYNFDIRKFTFLPVITLFWFSYMTFNFHKLQELNRPEESKNALIILNGLYIPSVFNIGRYNDLPLSLQIANYHLKKDDVANSNIYFSSGLKEFPFSFEVKKAYSKFLLRYTSNIDSAFHLASEVSKLNSYDNEINMLMAEVEVIRNESAVALDYLNRVFHNDYVHRKNLLYNYIFINQFDLNSYNYSFSNLSNNCEILENESSYSKDVIASINKLRKDIEREITITRPISDFITYCNIRYENYISFYSSIYCKDLNCSNNQRTKFKRELKNYLPLKKRYKILMNNQLGNTKVYSDSLEILNEAIKYELNTIFDSKQFEKFVENNILNRIN